MQTITISNKSAVSSDVELSVEFGEYIPSSNCIKLRVNDSELIGTNGISRNDELLMVEYSGSMKTTVDGDARCVTVGDSTIITTDSLENTEPDAINKVYTGIALSTDDDGNAYFTVNDDISSILSGNTVIDFDEPTSSGNIRRYHYVRYFIKRRYYSVHVGLTANNDYVGMNTEGNIENIIQEAKEGLIPGILNLEKIKFSPVYKKVVGSNTTYEKVDKIVIRFNFLHRDNWYYDGEKKTYFKTNSWTIDNRGWYTQDYESDTTIEIPASKKNATSTLLGYLGFTDGDVRFQKNKLSKSFARMSYYSTNDLLTNSLLNFSTVFVDGGELFGRYVKIDKSGEYPQFFDDEQLSAYSHTIASGANQLDCTLEITDEYDEAKSAEGFNIYLFSDDFKNASESEPGTIYLKIEFNHAGYGKTLQFMRPEGPSSVKLDEEKDVDFYTKAVFIPIEVFYCQSQKRFVYRFDEKRTAYDDGVIYLDLYEATITKQKKVKNLEK